MIDAAYVRDRLDYDPESGVFRWKKHVPKGRYSVGDVAGSMGSRYWRLSLQDKGYLAHRVAWLYMTGEWPAKDIDHINCDKLDNRFANLRCVSTQDNNQNIRKARADSRTGFLGVNSDRPGLFRAVIVANGKRTFLGRFKTAEEAHQVYVAAKQRLHPGCTLGDAIGLR